jgi:HlyD family type I secretion membrane fusion protein
LQQVVTQINDLEFRVPAIQSELDEVLRRQNELTTRARADAEKEAAEVAVTIAKLNEAITAMVDRKSRTNVVAPIDGRINRLLVSTVNGVVQPGQVLAQIVPDDLSIAVDARLSPKDRANVWPGLQAVIKISAYDYTVYGGLKGEVVEISPDALQDEKGNPYFRVRVRADGATLGDNNPIVPGMLAEVNILTGSHTVLDYLLRPVRRVQSNAFRQ